MAHDLLVQLDEYGRQLDAVATPLTLTPPEPTNPPLRFARHPWAVAVTAAIVTLTLIGAATWFLGGSDPVQPADSPEIQDIRTIADGITMTAVSQAPSMDLLYEVWQGADGLYASGDTGIWATSNGDTWEKRATPIAANGIVPFEGGFAGVTERGILQVTLDGRDWALPQLPHDVVVEHPAITLHYYAEDVAAGSRGLVVQGFATSSVKAAAVEAAYPDLGRVIDISRVAPCGPDGEPTPCDLENDDALWVRTADAEEPQAVSLSGMGLTRTDIWRAYRVMWFSADGTTFKTVTQRVLSESGYGPDPAGLISTPDGFVMIDIGVWASPDGRHWTKDPATPYEITDMLAIGPSVFGYTDLDQVVERNTDGSWTLLADPASFVGSELDHRSIEATTGLVTVIEGYEDVPFPEIADDEPLSTVRVVGVFANDAWTLISLEDAFSGTGALEIGIVGNKVVFAYGAGQPEDLENISEPEWWIATLTG